MKDRSKSYRERLNDLGITLVSSGRSTCPACSKTRDKSTEKCLVVTFFDNCVKYKCHHCNFNGVVHYSNNNMSSVSNVKKSYKLPEPIIENPEKDKLYRYFDKRGISQGTVEHFKIDLDSKSGIIFPYYKNNVLVSTKTRYVNKYTKKKTFIQTKDSESTLFGMDLFPNDVKELIWVEGCIDAMSFYEAGYHAVSIPHGGNDTKLECINNCFEFVDSFNTHIIAVDDDDVGHILRDNLINRLKSKIVKVVSWKEYGNFKDANEVLISDKEIIHTAINTAVEQKNTNIVTMYDNLQKILDKKRGIAEKTYSTGFANLDRIMKLQKQRLMVVTGLPSSGKSLFVSNILKNLSCNNEWRHLICSFESTVTEHVKTLSQMTYRKSFYDNSIYETMSEDELKDFITAFSEYYLFLDNTKSWKVSDIIEVAKYAVMRYKIDTLVIDPYNKLHNPLSDREDKYIERILSSLLSFAREYNILVIFIAHPTKLRDGLRIPALRTISGGSAWHTMADYGIVVHRNRNENMELENKSQIIVEKIKDDSIGNPAGGVTYLNYNFRLYAFEEFHGQ